MYRAQLLVACMQLQTCQPVKCLQVHAVGREAAIVTMNESKMNELLDGKLAVLHGEAIASDDVILVFDVDHYSGTLPIERVHVDKPRDRDGAAVVPCCPDLVER